MEELLLGFCITYIMHVSRFLNVQDLSSCKIDQVGQCHVLDEAMLPFPQIDLIAGFFFSAQVH